MSHPKHHENTSVEEIMSYWSRGHSLQETADHFEKSYRVIEQMVARHGYKYERAFN